MKFISKIVAKYEDLIVGKSSTNDENLDSKMVDGLSALQSTWFKFTPATRREMVLRVVKKTRLWIVRR